MSDAINSIKVALTGATNLIQVSSVDLWVESFMVEPHDSNSGKLYGGKSTFTVANKDWLFWLPAPASNFVETFNSKGSFARSFNLKELYIAGDNAEGCVVTYVLK